MEQKKPRRKRRGIEEEHEQHSELWLVSYADMITVLFILMVILYAMSTLDVAKYEKMAESLHGVFDPNGKSVSIKELSKEEIVEKDLEIQEKTKLEQLLSEEEAKEQKRLDELEKELRKYIHTKNLENEVSVKNTDRGVEITFQDIALFSSGSATLSEKAGGTLSGIIPFLKDNSRSILIEGHTDNVPMKSARFRDNFQLSNERALSVLYYLKDYGLNPNRLASAGYGEHKPVADNSTVQGKAKNRRVNMVILRNEVKSKSKE